MDRLFDIFQNPRVVWWYETALIALVFVPAGVCLGYIFVVLTTRSELAGADLTALGYALVTSPAVGSVACFGAVVLRLLGRLTVWVGCLAGLVAIGAFVLSTMFGAIALLVAIIMVLGAQHWPVILAALAGVIFVGVGMFKLLAWLSPPLYQDD